MIKKGRNKEVAEIVKYKRAALVGRMMLGEVNSEIESIFPKDFIKLPRKKIKLELEQIKQFLKGELDKFCNKNFIGLSPIKLSNLYEPIYKNGGRYEMPLTEFIEKFGTPKEGVLKNVPLHSTLSFTNWGLQANYPEMHLVNDIIVSFNSVIKYENLLKEQIGIKWEKVKDEHKKKEIKIWQMGSKAHKRFCLISCFNLIEAYINGISWDFAINNDLSQLSREKKNIITEFERPVSIIKKLIKAPKIIGNTSNGLIQSQEPLKTFIEVIKPYRDSIVHVSPFAASESFGGYNKLDKIYGLGFEIVFAAVEKTFEIIEEIHIITNKKYSIPTNIISKNKDGSYTLMELFENE